ncbi:hypothetical protein FRX31_003535 [Thalictrum thalictroides]|uniref:Uncharacterized protein n=1 Tax=Thalictrum thalictroides TaxID=46969 RepID=A0A7J6XB64_THATH|nr:hypothetical protein FRX31_003535 [Thalictrum thalictroides]
MVIMVKKNKSENVDCEDSRAEVIDIYSSSDDEQQKGIVLDFETQEGLSEQKNVIHFNDKGQLIGEDSAYCLSYLNSLTLKHCPISYDLWKDVPCQTKEMMWKLVTEKFTVCATYKKEILRKMHRYFKKFKSQLMCEHYDKYKTNEERKINCPQGVRQEDWDIFVNNQSTPKAQARRYSCMRARAARSPQTSQAYSRQATRTAKATVYLFVISIDIFVVQSLWHNCGLTVFMEGIIQQKGGADLCQQQKSVSSKTSVSSSAFDPKYACYEDLGMTATSHFNFPMTAINGRAAAVQMRSQAVAEKTNVALLESTPSSNLTDVYVCLIDERLKF